MLASYRFSTLRPVNNTLKIRGSKVAMRSPPECLLFNAAQRPTVGQWPERGTTLGKSLLRLEHNTGLIQK